jgi:trehalose/maltose transport system substrate-binding protein
MLAPPRLCSVFSAVALSFFLLNLTACGPQKPVKISIIDPEWSQPDELPRAERESAAFTRETGILLEHLPVPETSLAQLDLLRGLLRSHSASPDVVGIDVIWPALLTDYLVDLKSPLGADLSSQDHQVLGGYTVDGKLLAMPFHAHVAVLQYRSDLLQEYGYDRPPKTWDELEQMALRIQTGERAKGKKDFWGYVWQGAAGESLTCNALEWQAAEGGGQIIEKDKTISVNNLAAVRAWQRAAHWVGSISPPGVVAYRELDSMNVWNAGEVAFRRTWQWEDRLANWKDSALPDKTGYASLPAGPGGAVGTLGGIGLGVSRFSAHPEEALKLIRFLIKRQAQGRAEWQQESGEGRPPLLDLPIIVDPFAQAGQNDAGRERVIARPSNVAGETYEQVTKAYSAAVHAVLVGEKTAPVSAAELEKELVAITGFKTGPPESGN